MYAETGERISARIHVANSHEDRAKEEGSQKQSQAQPKFVVGVG